MTRSRKSSSQAAVPLEIDHVGVLGFGHMGQALAGRIHAGGFRTLVHDCNPERLQQVPQGIGVVSEIAGLACCDVVLTSLPDDAALEAVTRAPGGLFGVLGRHAVHVATSTVSPALSRRLAASHEALGQGFVVAAILGNPDMVRESGAFLLAGGSGRQLQRVDPLLKVLARQVFQVAEDAGMASLVKVASNALTGATVQGMGEILALLGKAGLPRRQAFDILTHTLFDGCVHKTYGGKILDERFLPAGMAAPLAVKDLRLALAEAEHWRVPMPLASAVHDRLVALMARGWGDLDWSALGALAAADAGLEVGVPSGSGR